LNEGVITPYQL